MRRAYSVEQVRAAEAALMARLPAGTLMQRAAAGLAAVCADLLPAVYGARVVVLVGSGDNGGDALYAAARLARRGAAVTAVLLSERAHPGGVSAMASAGSKSCKIRVSRAESRADARFGPGDSDLGGVLAAADLVIDGITGIGGKGGLREPAASVVHRVPATAHVVAVDLPSGVDATTGQVDGPAVRADVTVTFGALKSGLLVDPAAAHAGHVVLVDIGLDPYLDQPDVEALQAADLGAVLPAPDRDADKYRRGVVGVLAGSTRYPGAAVLTTGAALHGGAGYVRVAAAPRVAELVRGAWPEAVVESADDDSDPTAVGRVQAWAAGPGIGTDDRARDRLAKVLAADLPTVLDADALTLLATDPDLLSGRSASTLLTPHAGELARLLATDRGAVEARRLEHVRVAAQRYSATVLLKGSTTLVATPGRPTRANPMGSSWLATAGSGDVLTGLTGALLAVGLDPHDAGSVGAWLHGLAARLASAGGPISASDLVPALAAAYRTLTPNRGGRATGLGSRANEQPRR
jgi:hydroxyethylthiazole kinase-like uncharacterized protein yjeF